MNTILTVILIVLIAATFVGFLFSITLVRISVKKYLKLHKQQVALTTLRKELERVIADVEKLQQTVIDQAVTQAAKQMEEYLKTRFMN